MADREELRKLIDKLPEEELGRIASILHEVCEPSPEGGNAFDSIDQLIEKHTKHIPDEAWTSVPTDSSCNHDHYLYGAPKNEE